MRGVFVFVLAAGLVVPGMLRAQPPPRAPWWEGPVAKSLDLTDAQNKQIRATVSEYRDKLRDLRAAVNKSEGDLENVFNQENVDQHQANEAIDALAAARGELFQTTSQMDLKLRMILTAQQWQTLQSQQRGRGPGSLRRRGPGGPKGPIIGSAAPKP